MLENFKKVDNPLTVIAIFAGVAEVSMSAVAAFNSDLRATFIWFLMIFPVLLILLFFFTLNFNHKVLYAPSDFRDDSAFLDLVSPSAQAGTQLMDTAVKKLDEIQEQLRGGQTGAEIGQAIDVLQEAKSALDSLSHDQRALVEMNLIEVELMDFLSRQPHGASVDRLMLLNVTMHQLNTGLSALVSKGLVQWDPTGTNYMLSPEGRDLWKRLGYRDES